MKELKDLRENYLRQQEDEHKKAVEAGIKEFRETVKKAEEYIMNEFKKAYMKTGKFPAKITSQGFSSIYCRFAGSAVILPDTAILSVMKEFPHLKYEQYHEHYQEGNCCRSIEAKAHALKNQKNHYRFSMEEKDLVLE
jgi:hypothetical protein